MGRPRIHPRKLYRATETGFYPDPETGHVLIEYWKGVTIIPSETIEGVSLREQERIARRLVAAGCFELLGSTPEIERGSGEPTTVE